MQESEFMAVRLSRLAEVLTYVFKQNSPKLIIINPFICVCTNSELQCLKLWYHSFSPKLPRLSENIHNCKHQEVFKYKLLSYSQYPISSSIFKPILVLPNSLFTGYLFRVCLISGENRSDENSYESQVTTAYSCASA